MNHCKASEILPNDPKAPKGLSALVLPTKRDDCKLTFESDRREEKLLFKLK